MHKFNFDYDSENDDLFVFNPKSKSKGSVVIGSLILDFNSKKKVVGIEIEGASSFLASTNKEMNKKVLSNLKECRVDITAQNNLLLIKLLLFSQQKEMLATISAPNITKSNPALSY